MEASGFFKNGSASIFYKVVGSSGVPIVLVMGTGGDHNAWTPQVQFYEKYGYQVVVFDNRGTGRTSYDTSERLTFETMADDLEHLRIHLGIGKFHLSGLSLGGVIAQYYAQKYGERLLSLQLHETLARVNEELDSRIDDFMERIVPTAYDGFDEREGWARYNQELASYIAPFAFYSKESSVAKWVEGARRAEFPTKREGLMAHFQLDKEIESHSVLRGIRSDIPILVTISEKDRLVPAELGREVYSILKSTGIVSLVGYEFKDGCHLASIFDSNFNPITLKFLQEADRNRSKMSHRTIN